MFGVDVFMHFGKPFGNSHRNCFIHDKIWHVTELIITLHETTHFNFLSAFIFPEFIKTDYCLTIIDFRVRASFRGNRLRLSVLFRSAIAVGINIDCRVVDKYAHFVFKFFTVVGCLLVIAPVGQENIGMVSLMDYIGSKVITLPL